MTQTFKTLYRFVINFNQISSKVLVNLKNLFGSLLKIQKFFVKKVLIYSKNCLKVSIIVRIFVIIFLKILVMLVTPASGVGTTAVVLATARYYRSVLPPWSGTTALGAGISRLLPPRVYRPLSALT